MYVRARRVRLAVVSPDSPRKTYLTGLAAARSKTATGIVREVLPAQGDRALNEFITEYDWDEDQLNHERLEKLQNHGETRWSQDVYIVIDDSVFQRTGKELLGIGEFYDRTEGKPGWGQNLVYSFYTDDKTSYPLVFRQYEKADDEDQNDDDETKYDLSREMITELEEEVSVPADTYLLDSWLAHDSNLIKHVESTVKLGWTAAERSAGDLRQRGDARRCAGRAHRQSRPNNRRGDVQNLDEDTASLEVRRDTAGNRRESH
ncbi:transposase [Halocatena marina]|uniref:Transposase n=1 Tax=Halocatena marina TaxID=2934937 RepID=A0ABD5YUR6_9EURY|nr:transposase [Halocatena marina]